MRATVPLGVIPTAKTSRFISEAGPIVPWGSRGQPSRRRRTRRVTRRAAPLPAPRTPQLQSRAEPGGLRGASDALAILERLPGPLEQ
jgi:hypothetical protein